MSSAVQTHIAHQLALALASQSLLVKYPRVLCLVNTVEELRRLGSQVPTTGDIRTTVPAEPSGPSVPAGPFGPPDSQALLVVTDLPPMLISIDNWVKWNVAFTKYESSV